MTCLHRKPTKSSSSFSRYKSIFLFITMASVTLLSLLSLSLFFSLSESSHHRHSPPARAPHSPPSRTTPTAASAPLSVKQACRATRFPDACAGSLAGVSPDASPVQVIAAAIGVSSENLRTAQSMVTTILESSSGNKNRSSAASNCVEFLRNSEYRISGANEALPRGRSKDARAWMSAALLYQYDCWSALKYANDTQLVNQTMSFLDSSLIVSSSNALSMMASYDTLGNETSSWGPPRTERDGFWESGSGAGSGLGSRGGFPSKLTADVTVCKGGGCNYEKVQAGVNAAPNDVVGGKRFVIHVKEGVYEEIVRIGIEKKNVVLLGDGMGKTVVTGSLNVGQTGISTYNTATVG